MNRGFREKDVPTACLFQVSGLTVFLLRLDRSFLFRYKVESQLVGSS